jgi:hypothetical protein
MVRNRREGKVAGGEKRAEDSRVKNKAESGKATLLGLNQGFRN